MAHVVFVESCRIFCCGEQAQELQVLDLVAPWYVGSWASLVAQKASTCDVGDLVSVPGSGRSPGEGNGNSLQYSCLGNPMDGGAWWATVHGVAKSRTQLSDFTMARGLCSSDQIRSVAQSCPILCDPMDCSLPGSSVHEICQARVLEWDLTL